MRNSWILLAATGVTLAQSGPPAFEPDVAPVLAARCAACHSAKTHAGGLSLESEQDVLRGGQSGPAVVPGRPAESLLLTMVASGKMPKTGPKLNPDQVDLIRRWIESRTAASRVTEREVVM